MSRERDIRRLADHAAAVTRLAEALLTLDHPGYWRAAEHHAAKASALIARLQPANDDRERRRHSHVSEIRS